MSELRDRVARRLAEFQVERWQVAMAEKAGMTREEWRKMETFYDLTKLAADRLPEADEVLRIVAWNRARGNKPTTLPPGDWKP